MELSDEAKRDALLAAEAMKNVADAKKLHATPETIQDVEMGSPRTPGYDEHTGKTMKDAPQWPQEVEPNEQNRDEETPATTGNANGNAFEQALAEKLKEATPASFDKPHDIDR